MTSGTTQPQAPRSAFLRSATVVAVAMAIMNVAAYGFTLIGSRRLMPEQFGAITALLGLLLIGNVASLGSAGRRRSPARHPHRGRRSRLADAMLQAVADRLSVSPRSAWY